MLFRNECQEWQPRWLWLWLRFQRFAVAAVVWKNSKTFPNSRIWPGLRSRTNYASRAEAGKVEMKLVPCFFSLFRHISLDNRCRRASCSCSSFQAESGPSCCCFVLGHLKNPLPAIAAALRTGINFPLFFSLLKHSTFQAPIISIFLIVQEVLLAQAIKEPWQKDGGWVLFNLQASRLSFLCKKQVASTLQSTIKVLWRFFLLAPPSSYKIKIRILM